MSTYLIGHVKGDKGDTGATGAAAGFGTPTASVDANIGTPSVTVTASGPDTAKEFDFQFQNLKGEPGPTGPADTTALNMIRNTSTDAYSTSKAYKVGDLCIRNNTVYKCITACSAGSWATNSSCFTATTLTGAVTDLNASLTQLDTSLSKYIFSNNSTYHAVNQSISAGGTYTCPTDGLYRLECSNEGYFYIDGSYPIFKVASSAVSICVPIKSGTIIKGSQNGSHTVIGYWT